MVDPIEHFNEMISNAINTFLRFSNRKLQERKQQNTKHFMAINKKLEILKIIV